MAKRKIPKEEIPQMVRFEKLNELAMKIASPEALSTFIKANPSYFDGTQVQASHILLSCGAGSSTEERTKVRKELEKIAAEVKADKIKFADAAKTHSKCPSGKSSGGDLGAFAFHRMVPPFSVAAFGMKVNDVSGIVETPFGYHIIKVTKRTEGTGKPGPNAQQIARQIVLGNFSDKIISESRAKNPVRIIKQPNRSSTTN